VKEVVVNTSKEAYERAEIALQYTKDLARKIHDKAMNNGCKVLSLK